MLRLFVLLGSRWLLLEREIFWMWKGHHVRVLVEEQYENEDSRMPWLRIRPKQTPTKHLYFILYLSLPSTYDPITFERL